MTQLPDLEDIMNALPYPCMLLSPDLTVAAINDAYLRATNRARKDVVGIKVFEAFPPDPNDIASGNAFLQSFKRVFSSGEPDTLALVRYPVVDPTPGATNLVERFWNVVHTPILDAQGKTAFMLQTPIDVTELHALRRALQATHSSTGSSAAEGPSQLLETANRMLDTEISHLRTLFAQAPGFVYIVRGPQHVFEMANEAYYQLVGHRDLIGKPFRETFPDLENQAYGDILDRVYATGEAFVGHDMRTVLQRTPESPAVELYIDVVVQPILSPDGSVICLFVQGHDMTVQKHAQDELRISNERLKLAIEGTGDGLWDWDLRTGRNFFSRQWKEILGYADEEIGESFKEWRSRLHPQDAERTMAAVQDCIDGKTSTYISEHRLRAKDGKWKWVLSRGVIVARDEQGRPLRMIGTMSDITAKKESDERVWRQANFDTLTRLPNRRLFRDRLEQEVKKAHRAGLRAALLFIDLDRFKEVNDLLGHDAGDQLLKQAALRLSECVRESDTVARLGGDEFTVILSELEDIAHVELIAQKLLAKLTEPFRLGTEVAYVSGSIGITLYPTDAEEPEELIRNADQAMYAAKSAGRNQFSYFTRSMQEQARVRLRLGRDLRNALRSGQLQVHYQPVVDLVTGRIAKAEALLRWNHPTQGLVAPSQFIPLAEESGMINEIGDWVFREAAAWSQRWGAQRGAPFQISVNKSPVQFLSQDEDTSWTQHLESLGLAGNSIAIEITEGILLNASATVSDKLLEYRDAGIQVAIDDFGTGYSSMAYLKKFDIDYLKIDQSFVRDLTADESDRAIAESIIVMAHRLGLKVIAEGIETSEQESLLVAAGCDYGQGFLYAGAAPPADFERMLAQEFQLASGPAH
ncbi:MAG TPA: EAL domain-containing protein [Noviherbaspirillum sp.]|nr:EAL domain-containing protein [Noviherbaspirillum sp.]